MSLVSLATVLAADTMPAKSLAGQRRRRTTANAPSTQTPAALVTPLHPQPSSRVDAPGG